MKAPRPWMRLRKLSHTNALDTSPWAPGLSNLSTRVIDLQGLPQWCRLVRLDRQPRTRAAHPQSRAVVVRVPPLPGDRPQQLKGDRLRAERLCSTTRS